MLKTLATVPISAYDLQLNGLAEPVISDDNLLAAWKVVVSEDGETQAEYQIQVFDDKCNHIVWDSGRVASHDHLQAPVTISALVSFTSYRWRVQLWSSLSRTGDDLWSEWATFETGRLGDTTWIAQWITGPKTEPGIPLYVKGRIVNLSSSTPSRARAYASALGWYRLLVNGTDVTKNDQVPRFTPFDHVVEYQAYDITPHLHPGRDNSIVCVVGDGRFRGGLSFFDNRKVYGDRLAAFVQVQIEYDDIDGHEPLLFSTDDSWTVESGPIVVSDPKTGEQVDLRDYEIKMATVTSPSAYSTVGASILPHHSRQLIPEQVKRVGQVGRLDAARLFKSPKGKLLVDFGLNVVGVCSLLVPSGEGELSLTFSEVLTLDGELNTDYLMPIPVVTVSIPQDKVILDPSHSHRFQPWFTTRGFRFVEISGPEQVISQIKQEDIQAVILSSQLDPTGSFSCSNESLNTLHANVFNSLRGNFTDTATDCPTRERSGWTGDIQVFSPTACLMVDCQAFLRRYLVNLALEQLPDGTIPPIIPSESSVFSGGLESIPRRQATSAGWGDVSVILPWNLYLYHGDVHALKSSYDTARRWVCHLENRAATKVSWRRYLNFWRWTGSKEKYIVDTGFHWSEWLRPGETGLTSMLYNLFLPSAVVPTAYLAHSSLLLSKMAGVLGYRTDELHFAELSNQVRQAWREAFVSEASLRGVSRLRIGEDKQDEYVRALAFDLLLPQQRKPALDRLVQLIESRDCHLGTGFLSTPLLLRTLTDNGAKEMAYRLLLQTTPPSWLAQVEKGATSVWETWTGHEKDGRPSWSHNHYALGSVAQFLYEAVAGLRPIDPGWKTFEVEPVIGGDIENARASVMTPYGRASVEWKANADTLELSVQVPEGTTAVVSVAGNTTQVEAGCHSFSYSRE